MPATASFQTILRELDELLLAESVQRALAQNKTGRGIPAEQVKELQEGWIRESKQYLKSESTRICLMIVDTNLHVLV